MAVEDQVPLPIATSAGGNLKLKRAANNPNHDAHAPLTNKLRRQYNKELGIFKRSSPQETKAKKTQVPKPLDNKQLEQEAKKAALALTKFAVVSSKKAAKRSSGSFYEDSDEEDEYDRPRGKSSKKKQKTAHRASSSSSSAAAAAAMMPPPSPRPNRARQPTARSVNSILQAADHAAQKKESAEQDEDKDKDVKMSDR